MGLGAILPMSALTFVLLLPEMQDAYHQELSILALVAVQQLQTGLGPDLVLALVANQTSRTRVLVGAGGFFTAAAAVLWLAGVFPNQILLYAGAIGVVLGGGALTSTQNSLLCDYYPVGLRPRVILAQRAALVFGLTLCPLLVGTLAYVSGWQASFFVLAAAALVFVVLAARLPDPVPAGGLPGGDPDARRTSGRAGHAARGRAGHRHHPIPSPDLLLAPVPPGDRARPHLLRHRVLRERLPPGRGAPRPALRSGRAGSAHRPGHRICGPAPRIAADPGKAMRTIAWLAVAAAAGAACLALAPDVAVAYAAQLVFAGASAVVIAGVYAMLSVALPTRMLTLGFGLSTVWLTFGALLIGPPGGVPTVNSLITDAFGYRASFWLFVPLFVIGASLLRSASRFVAEDIAKRKITEMADATVRRERADGTGHLLMVRSLDAGYDGVQVVFGVDLDVGDGEMVAVLGTNGAGKSTLMRAISGLVVPTAGEVMFDGKAITTYEAHRITEAGILQVPGGRGIFPGLTVAECLRVAGWLYDADDQDLARATETVLDYFPVLSSRWQTPAGSLSGGEQQMLSLSMAFIAKPKLLIIDELSLGLAPTVIESLLGIVKGIHDRGSAVILVEQSINLALRLCDRAIFMEKGQVVFSGSTADLLDRQDIVRAVLLGGANDAPPDTTPALTVDTADLAPPADAALDSHHAVLSARGLYQRFGGVVAVNDVDLDLFQGEILGLLGPNGAGKTTIFELLSGERRSERGRITMGDDDITSWPAYRRAEHGLGRSFQAARLWPGLTVDESVIMAISHHISSPGAAAAMLCLPTVRRSERRLRQAADEILEPLGLAQYSDQLTSDLSTGVRRLLELAVIIAMGPSIVLLDEPSAGLAQAETEAMAPVLLETKRRLDCSMILIEHDMGLLRQLADRAIALDIGAVVTTGNPEDVLNHPHVIESYLGVAAR